jgi:hypothetical protein
MVIVALSSGGAILLVLAFTFKSLLAVDARRADTAVGIAVADRLVDEP